MYFMRGFSLSSCVDTQGDDVVSEEENGVWFVLTFYFSTRSVLLIIYLINVKCHNEMCDKNDSNKFYPVR